MHRILAYLASGVAALVSAGCSSQYDINGNSNLSVVDGSMAYLHIDSREVESGVDRIDSCIVEHGRFRFGGDMDSVVFARICLSGGLSIPLVIEDAPITVRIDAVGQTVEGGVLNQQLYKFLQKRDRLENRLWKAEQEFIHALRHGCDDIEDMREKLEKQTNKIKQEIEEAEIKFIRDNYTNALGPGYFMILCDQQGLPVMTEQMLEIIAKAPESFIYQPSIYSYLMTAGYDFNNLSKKKHKKK